MHRSSKKPPSRIRYEREHPVISFRVDKELFARLQVLRYQSGRSYTDFIKVGAGLMEPDVGDAWLNGYEEAKADYCVMYPCSVCGELIEVMGDAAKQVCRDALIIAGWGHASCIDKGRSQI